MSVSTAKGGGSQSQEEPDLLEAEKLDRDLTERARSMLAEEAAKTPVSQLDALASSRFAREEAANISATIGTYYCAEGAATVKNDAAKGGKAFAACGDHFRAARELSGEAELKIHPRSIDHPSAATIRSMVDSEFGPGTSDPLLEGLLRTEGKPALLVGLLANEVGHEKLETALASTRATDQKAADPPGEVGKIAGRKAPARAPSSLREKLKKALADSPGPASARANQFSAPSAKQAIRAEEIAVQGNAMETLLGAADELEELTLFAVVHRKYLQYHPRFTR